MAWKGEEEREVVVEEEACFLVGGLAIVFPLDVLRSDDLYFLWEILDRESVVQ